MKETDTGQSFDAPWDRVVWIISLIASAILLVGTVVLLYAYFDATDLPVWPKVAMLGGAIISIGSLVGAALYAPRGYVLAGDTLRIKRWAGEQVIRLTRSTQVTLLEGPLLRRAIRLFGSGGLFGYFGIFYTRELGKFLMAATRTQGRVIVRPAPNSRAVIITPESPEQFIEAIDHLWKSSPGT
jgi:hypothetical protein